jgi:hypothetical protein
MAKAGSKNAMGLGLAIVGGAPHWPSRVFLPFDEQTGPFRMVSQNTLIQLGAPTCARRANCHSKRDRRIVFGPQYGFWPPEPR